MIHLEILALAIALVCVGQWALWNARYQDREIRYLKMDVKALERWIFREAPEGGGDDEQ